MRSEVCGSRRTAGATECRRTSPIVCAPHQKRTPPCSDGGVRCSTCLLPPKKETERAMSQVDTTRQEIVDLMFVMPPYTGRGRAA